MPRELGFGRVGVPIEACWRCQNCKSINYSSGELICRPRKAKDIAIRNVTRIILDPRTNAAQLQDALNNKRCRNKACLAKPQWARTTRQVNRFPITIMMYTLILGWLIADLLLSLMDNPLLWVSREFFFDSKSIAIVLCIYIFLGVLLFTVSLRVKKKYENRVKKLPEEYMPVIITSDYLVVSYAKAHGKVIPTRQQAIAILSERYSNTNDE